MSRLTSTRAFTLVELLGVIVIFAALGGVISPVVLEATGAHRRAVTQRDAAQRAGYALERAVRLLRNTPPATPGDPTPGLAVALDDTVERSDGARVELIGTTLWLTPEGGVAAPLCQGVDAFELDYIGADGAADTSASPGSTQRIAIRIVVDGFELRTVVFLRITEGLE